ncbi:Cysteine proteinase inhibitor [Heracleum sosnowskyi]|uniref:Cysteine proteinase inhibitor n=1 Tax=Heracleum sosnowskyi TaxID=360622 RepID=A0AAD8ICI2_9APIA|nr:Cysteine proteinase inhibitor [Heracleum sosnowskyi]
MSLNFKLLVLISIFISPLFSSAETTHTKILLGGYVPINDTTTPEIQAIAKFAVSEHNNESKTHVTYMKIVKGEKQVVAGINYRLIIEAKDRNEMIQHYEAIVYVKAGTDSRKLVSFGPIEE